MLTDKQNDIRSAKKDIFENDFNFLNSAINGDKSCIFKTTRKGRGKVHRDTSQGLTPTQNHRDCFFGTIGIIYHEFLPI